MKGKRVIVVGGGLAGLATTMKLAEKGVEVDLLSVTKVRRSHSVCAQGGINVAVNLKGEGDSPLIHAYDTLKGGDFLAHQPPVLEMCMAGPAILRMLDRLGCPFNRTAEGNIAFRKFGGTLYDRTAFTGSSTGQQLLYALDEQVRRFEAMGRVRKFEHHEFLRLIREENGKACGVVCHDLFTMELHALLGSAVVIATGGLGFIYKQSTNSTFCSGAANGRLFLQGMKYANGEFIQIHPTAIPGSDKLRLITETCRGEGGRLWVFGDSSKTIEFPDKTVRSCGKTGEPWYFLEEMYPAFGNLVPRDIGARECLRVCELGLGIEGKMQVHLDLTHLPPERHHRLESTLDIYKKFTGVDPRKHPMKIFPAVHYTMGGAWVDWPAADDPDRWSRFRQMTNLEGCFTVGEADYLYHGANRLGGNSLLSCIFGGLVTGGEVARFVAERGDVGEGDRGEALAKEREIQKGLLQRKGKENVHLLHDELSEWMVRHVTVKRDNKNLARTLEKIYEIEERYEHISLDDKEVGMNQTYVFAHQFLAMLQLAKVITKGALLRDEFRGSHFKPEFPKRDDANWLKTTIATFDPGGKEPHISYEKVDTRHIDPIERDYTHAKKVTPEFRRVPSNIQLPL